MTEDNQPQAPRPMTRDERVAHRPPQPPAPFEMASQVIDSFDGAIFVNKPAGWATSGRSLDDPDCVQYELMQYLGRKIWVVHQLDADTSGLNIFTRPKSTVQVWHARIKYPQAQKEYLALVHGRVDRRMQIDAPIGRRSDGSWGVSPDGKVARTILLPVVASDAYSLLRVQLRTGRTHQIRVHLQHIGHPLVGEFWYNDAPCLLAERHMLHAWRTQFTGVQGLRAVVAGVPEDFVACAQRLQVGLPSELDGDSIFSSRIRPQ